MGIGKKFLVGLLIVGLSLMTVAGISFAADNSSTGTATSNFVAGCRGFVGGAIDEVAKLLRLKPEEIIEKRNSGESLADIAKDQGVSKDEVVSTILETREKLLDERVKAGVITKEQEDFMLERMKSRVDERVQDPTVGPGAGRGGCYGPGAGGGFGPGARGGYGPGAGGGFRNAPTSVPNV